MYLVLYFLVSRTSLVLGSVVLMERLSRCCKERTTVEEVDGWHGWRCTVMLTNRRHSDRAQPPRKWRKLCAVHCHWRSPPAAAVKCSFVGTVKQSDAHRCSVCAPYRRYALSCCSSLYEQADVHLCHVG